MRFLKKALIVAGILSGSWLAVMCMMTMYDIGLFVSVLYFGVPRYIGALCGTFSAVIYAGLLFVLVVEVRRMRDGE